MTEATRSLDFPAGSGASTSGTGGAFFTRLSSDGRPPSARNPLRRRRCGRSGNGACCGPKRRRVAHRQHLIAGLSANLAFIYASLSGDFIDTAFVLRYDLAAPPNAPSLTGVRNAASYRPGNFGQVAPGEIVTLFGAGLGPAALMGLHLNSAGLVDTTIARVQVLFDGKPVPLLYVSASQVAAVAPYSLAAKDSTVVQVVYNAQRSNPIALTVAPFQAGIFTVDASGKGQAAALNEDGSLNSASHPAARGSVIVLFATGEGQTNPPGVDGSREGRLIADEYRYGSERLGYHGLGWAIRHKRFLCQTPVRG